MNRTVWRLLLVCLGVVLALGVVGVARLADEPCGPLSRTACVRVLFLGNSYTYVNDLPTVFRDLARAGGRNVETGMVANGGETLAQHAASSDSLGAIRGSPWQFVVLQEQSEIPALASAWQTQMFPAAETLVATIRSVAATPVLLETWAHRDGLPDQGLDYAAMQAAITQGYRSLGATLGVAVAPAGEAWQSVLQANPTIALWQADGSHPSPAGTYLAACVLYDRIFDASPVGISDAGGLSSDVAHALQVAAGSP
ncbi:MAG: SGNH/GDSL hydrolase family protein [Candidatus Limnocylindrales bacterium]|jgi:hypothetical protein|nr:SGNH/GDSL hydrolase family protein [Candidatus Limnocylindrales bacterium]